MLLRDLIPIISGHSVIPANRNIREINALKNAINSIIGQTIYARRPNDISNNTHACGSVCLEELLVNTFNNFSNNSGLKAKWLSSSGYPDIEIVDLNDIPKLYIEVKVTTRSNPRSQRDFYISPGSAQVSSVTNTGNGLHFDVDITPGNTPRKIRGDASHVLVLFRFSEDLNCPNVPSGCKCWKLNSYELYDLYPLNLNLKLEFNTNYKKIIETCPRL